MTSVEYTLLNIANAHSLDVTQLKVIYFRGVAEFVTNPQGAGPPSLFGLARVHRFLIERGETIDCDLVSPQIENLGPSDTGYVITENTPHVPDVMYSNAESIVQAFEPATVESVEVDSEQITVTGFLGDVSWRYTLNSLLNEAKLEIL